MALVAASRLRQPGFVVGFRSRSSDDVARRVALRDSRAPLRNSCRSTSLPPIEGARESPPRQLKCGNPAGTERGKERLLPPLPRGAAQAPAAPSAWQIPQHTTPSAPSNLRIEEHGKMAPAQSVQSNRRSGSSKLVLKPIARDHDTAAPGSQRPPDQGREPSERLGSCRRQRSGSSRRRSDGDPGGTMTTAVDNLDAIPTPARRPRSPGSFEGARESAFPAEKMQPSDIADKMIALARPSHLRETSSVVTSESLFRESETEEVEVQQRTNTAASELGFSAQESCKERGDASAPSVADVNVDRDHGILKAIGSAADVTTKGDGAVCEVYMSVAEKERDASEEEAFCRSHQPEITEMLRTGGRARLQKRGEGGVGLLNQGATCYMNSLLQALFHTPEFRLALFSFEYSSGVHGDAKRCIPLQLQRLFSELQLSIASAVSTKALTAACGFTAMDAMEQHDVQELCRVLFDALGRSAASLARQIDGLYAGKAVHYVRSRELHNDRLYEGRQEEKFLDIQLPIADCSTLEEALRKLLQPEILEGDNCWFCEELSSKVPALKGVEFEQLPQIFCLQLNRFVFDHNTMRRRKLTDEIFIPLTIDLGFLLSNTHESAPINYSLMAICLHRGTAHGGHYHAYVQEPHTLEWRDANDSTMQVLGSAEMERLFPQRQSDSVMANVEESTCAHASTPRGFSSADAYFLIYRRSTLHAPQMRSSDVPEPHCSEIQDENVHLADLQRAFLLQQQLLEVKVFAPSAPHCALARNVAMQLGSLLENGCRGIAEEPQSITLSVSERRTMSHILAESLSAFDEEASKGAHDWKWATGLKAIQTNSVRLRRCDTWCRELGKPIAESELTLSLHETFGQQAVGGLRSQICLQLDVNINQQEFEPWDETFIPTTICVWDAKLGTLSPSPKNLFNVFLPAHPNADQVKDDDAKVSDSSLSEKPVACGLHQRPSPTVGAVRQAAALACGVDRKDLALVPLTGSQAGKQLLDDTVTLASCGVTVRDVICAETRKLDSDELQSVGLYERILNTLHLRFNHPDRPLQPDEFELVISKTQTLAELKSRIAGVLELDEQSLHLRRNRKAPQLKDETKTLRVTSITDNDVIFVGNGAPCGIDECLLQVSLYSREKGSQKSIEMFELPALCTSSVRSLREALVEPLAKWRASEENEIMEKWPENIQWEKIRLRDGQSGRQFAVLRDDRTLRSALPGWGDGRQVAVQFLDAEESLGQDDVIIAVRPWRILEGRLHAPTEIIINKTQTLAEFHAMLSSRFSGLLQAPQANEDGEPGEPDCLQIVAVPGSTGGPPLTSQRCLSLKWVESNLNTSLPEAQASSLAGFREFRDGATFVVRSHLAAAAAASEVSSEAVHDAPSKQAGKAAARPGVKSGARKPVPFSLAAPSRRERSLHIEVLCPDEGDKTCTVDGENA